MITIQIKDNCYSCFGVNLDCESCKGVGEIYAWITLEELAKQIEDINQRKTERFEFPSIAADHYKEINLEGLDLPPNPNI